jgi:hypothetical protein
VAGIQPIGITAANCNIDLIFNHFELLTHTASHHQAFLSKKDGREMTPAKFLAQDVPW